LGVLTLKNREDLNLTSKVSLNKNSNSKLAVQEDSGDWVVPYVIEPSAGVERSFLAILNEAYTVEDLDGEKNRTVLKLKPHLSPVKAAIMPLKKNNSDLVDIAKKIKNNLQQLGLGRIILENSGNIGKGYRRHDEIGTPICITVDYETLDDETVTIRDRDTMLQSRHKISEISDYLINIIKY
jgi:Glycyl-tRNA synthetase (class II)